MRPQEPDPAPAPAAPQFQFTPDQVKDITEFRENFPEVDRAVQALMGQQAFTLASHVFNQIAARYEPLMAQVQALADANQLSSLRASVEGYDTIDKADVLKWVESQPSYLRTAYEHVVQQGTADDVADLLARYRVEVAASRPAAPAQASQPAPNAAPAPKVAPAPKATPRAAPSPAAQAAARGMAPVQSTRTAPPQPGVAQDDFAGAFAAFAKEA